MFRLRSRLLLSLFLFLFSGVLGALDLSDPATYLKSFLRARADLSGEEVFFHWTGKVYGFVPGERRTELFDFEGFSVLRLTEVEDGWQILGREASFFKDTRTGEILTSWRNPYLKNEIVPVIHVWNDPVNQSFIFPAEELPFVRKSLPSEDLGDELVFYLDLFPYYESPLSRRDYSQNSQSDIYQAAEFMQLFVPLHTLEDETQSRVPCQLGLTRITPWLPFMKMGDRKGNLIFVCRGQKLEGGFEALPAKIKAQVLENNPQFASAPLEYSQPNETSWSYFKKLYEAGLIK